MGSLLDELAETVSGVARAVGPSVVGVRTRLAVGSGVVIGPGQVLTNAHNLGEAEPTVVVGEGPPAPARVLGADPDSDLAVLQVPTGDAPAVRWGGEVGVGAPVVALANPGGRGLHVTLGLVSGTGRSFRGPRGTLIAGAVEHTAPLPPGSSGGPLVDRTGALVGVNTHRLTEGFYLALGASPELRRRVEALARGQVRARARLGVAVAPSEVARRLRRAVGLPEREGILVRHVEAGSPAHRAGLREGDLIVGAGGRAVASPEDLSGALAAAEQAGVLQLRVVRVTEERTVEVRW